MFKVALHMRLGWSIPATTSCKPTMRCLLLDICVRLCIAQDKRLAMTFRLSMILQTTGSVTASTRLSARRMNFNGNGRRF
jgi:hypothetical protein